VAQQTNFIKFRNIEQKNRVAILISNQTNLQSGGANLAMQVADDGVLHLAQSLELKCIQDAENDMRSYDPVGASGDSAAPVSP